jgi:replicative DNA helicase
LSYLTTPSQEGPPKGLLLARAPSAGVTFFSLQNAPALIERNLKYMRAFGEAWPDPAFVRQPAAQIPWTHHRMSLNGGLILCRIKNRILAEYAVSMPGSLPRRRIFLSRWRRIFRAGIGDTQNDKGQGTTRDIAVRRMLLLSSRSPMATIEDNLRKLPPQSIEAEESVLGGVLLDNTALDRAIEFVTEDDFYREAHRKIMRAMIELNQRGEPVDLVTLSDALKTRGDITDIGGAVYLAELSEKVPTAANVAYYARIVRQKAILRSLIQTATEIATMGYEATADVDDFLDQAEHKIFEISERKVRPTFFRIRDIMVDSMKTIEQLYERKELVTGVATGFVDFDRMTAGLQPSDLIVIAGRPSMGKTAFALNIAQYAALNSKTGVAVFSLEMSKEQLVLRLLCSEARVDQSKVRAGFAAERDFPKLAMAASRLSDAPIYIDDTPALSVLELRAKARRLKRERESKLGLIVVDYLQLMRGHDGADNREQEISGISRSLKALAKELNVPVVALSQLNRQVETRAEKRPVMADLRESGAIEQDADVIGFLFRPIVYDKNAEERAAEIVIAKQRNGPIGTVPLTFMSEYTRFENRAEDDVSFGEVDEG